MICRDYCIENGLIMRATRDTMLFSPPLVITEDEVDLLVARAQKSVEQTYARVKDEVVV